MLSKDQREYFETLLGLVHLIYFEAYGTIAEYDATNILLSIEAYARKYCDADSWEMFAIMHNSHCQYSGLQRITDIDKYIEERKLDEILHDVNLDKGSK